MQRKDIIKKFLEAKHNELGDIRQWFEFVVDFIDQPQADQRTELTNWATAYKAQLQANKDALEAQKIATEQRLTTEINQIDGVTL